MNYQLKCLACGCLYWRSGDYEPDTNVTNITDRRGDACPACDSGDGYDIVNQEYAGDDEP